MMELLKQVEKQQGKSERFWNTIWRQRNQLKAERKLLLEEKKTLQAETKALLRVNMELMHRNEKWTRLTAELKFQKIRLELWERGVLEKGAKVINTFWNS